MGTRSIQLNQPDDSPGNFATLRSLTLNAQGAAVTLPPGRYERIILNGGSTLQLHAGTVASPALYEIQQIDLNGGSRIDVPGPVDLRLKNSLNANGYIGNPAHPEWLTMGISSGSFTLNRQSAFHGTAIVPEGTLTVNGGSLLHGLAFVDRLTLNGGGVIECEASGGTRNQAPVATGSEVTTPIGAPLEIQLQATDPEGRELSYLLATPPLHGTIGGTSGASLPGSTVTYTPDLGFVGSDIFYFKASDGVAESEPAAVVVHVFQPNRPPLVESPVFVINQGETHAPLLLAASDPEGDPLTYQILTPPGQGTLGGTAPALTYAHTGNRSSVVVEDRFTYRATDSSGAISETGTVTLLLQPVNRPPSAPGLILSTTEDLPLAFTLPGADEDGDALVHALSVPDGFPGTLAGEAPALIFVPAADCHGTASFSYEVTDPSGATASGLVVITLLPANDPPVARAMSAGGEEDQAIAIVLSASDIDGDGLEYSVALPADFPGSLNGQAPALEFVPDADFEGTTFFEFTATDPSGLSSTARVDLTIIPGNDPPLAEDSKVQGRQGAPLTIPLVASDPDGDVLIYAVSTLAAHGSVAIAEGKAIYLAEAGFSGIDRFHFTVHDGMEESEPAEVVVRVAANPAVALLSPLPGARFPAGTPVIARIGAADRDGDLSVVELTLNGVRVGSGTAAPWELVLGDLAAGEHVLVATAIDAAGGKAVSAPVAFAVDAVNRAPVVAAGSDRVAGFGLLGSNLLLNGGNEQALVNGQIPGWTAVGGVAWGQGTPWSRVRTGSFGAVTSLYPAAGEGSVFFHVPANAGSELVQEVALDDQQRAAVAGGSARMAFEALTRSYQRTTLLESDLTGRPSAYLPTGMLDRPSAQVEFRDDGGSLLASYPAEREPVHDRWAKIHAVMPVPVTATQVRIRLIAGKTDPGTEDPQEKNDAMFDAVSLRLAAPADEFLSGAVADDGLPTMDAVVTRWSQVAGPAAILADPDQATTAVAFPAPGDFEFRLDASDGELSSSDAVRIRLDASSGNRPPAVAAGPDMRTGFTAAAIPLAGLVTDDSEGLSIEWSQVSGPGNVSFADPLSPATSVTVPGPGIYVLKLAAYDGEWAAEDQVVVELTDDGSRLPLDVVMTIDHSGSMWANKADGDPDTPIHKARLAASFLISRLDPALDRVSVRKFYAQVMPLSSDLSVAKASLTQPRGEPGTEGSFAPSNIDRGIQGALDHLLANPRSGPHDRVIVAFNDGAGPYSDVAAKAARNAGVRVIVVSFSNGIDPIDTANMRLQAKSPSDFLAAATPDEALPLFDALLRTLRLSLNTPPLVNAGQGFRLADLSESAFLQGSYTDDGLPDGALPAISWEQLSGPGTATFSSPSRLDPRVSFSIAGEYRLRLTVDDGALASSDTVTVQVAHPSGLPAPAAMTAWWPFDGNLRDHAGTRDLTRQAYWESPRFTAGAVHEAVQMLESGDILGAGAAGEIGLNAAAGFSIEFRFKPRATAAGYLVALFNPATGVADKGITWGHPNLNPTSSAGHLYFLAPPATATAGHGDLKMTAATLPLDTWHHALITHERSTNETWLYLNGQGRRIFTAAISPHFAPDRLLYLGGLPPTREGLNSTVTSDPQRRFDGDLDDLAFYARPLAAAEAEQLYQAVPQGKHSPTLNRPPVVDAGDALRAEGAGTAAALHGLVSDDDARPRIAWSMISGPGSVTFADAAAASTSATFSETGIYTLRLTASDAFTSASDTVQAHVGLPAAASVPPGLVAWMPGNRHAVDLVTGRGGIWSGAESYAPVKAGEGFQFGDAVSRVRYLPPAVAPADTGRGFSIESWLALPEAVASFNADILVFHNTAGAKVQRLYLAEFTTATGQVPGLIWATSNGAGGNSQTLAIQPLPLGRPFHLALTCDPVTGRKKAYVDGVQVADQTLLAGTSHHFEKECFIGNHPGDPSIYTGQVDELSLYNVALTPAQILAIFQAGSSGKFPGSPPADPRVDAGPDLALSPGDSHSFTPVIDSAAFTAGPLVITWSQVSGQGTVLFDNATLAHATVTVPEAGRHVVLLTVTDGVTTVSDALTLDVVTLPNQAPLVELPATAVLQLPNAILDLDPQVSDDGRPSGLLEHRWIQLDGPAPLSFTATGRFRARAGIAEAGDYTAVLEVSDGLAVTRREMVIHVIAAPSPNQAPVVAAGEDFTASTVSFLLGGSAGDDGLPAGQPLGLSWSMVTGPGPVVFADPTAAATTASVGLAGTYRLRLFATDGERSSADEIVVVIPESAAGFPNLAPRVALPAIMTASLPAVHVTLIPAVEDDGRTAQDLTYLWSQLDGPVAAEIASPVSASSAIYFTVEGDYLFELLVSDGELSGVARTRIVVGPSNNAAPVVTMAAAVPARPLERVTLSATVSDDGLPSGALSYRWTQLAGPAEVVIEDPLSLETPVTFGAGGSYLFELHVFDGQLSTRGTVVWNVLGVPELRVDSPAAGQVMSDRSLLVFQARALIDGGTITSVGFEENGVLLGQATPLPGSDDWQLTLPPLAIGDHTLVATARSTDGQTTVSEPVAFSVIDYREDSFAIEIRSPSDGDSITRPVEVIGTAQIARLASWILTLTPVVPDGAAFSEAPVVIASGAQPVNDGLLGALDPTLMQNGAYTLTLAATTTYGASASDSLPLLIEGNLKIGHFAVGFQDLSIPLAGLPLEVTRTYDSRDSRAGDFGPGWNMGLSSVKVRKVGRLGEGWEQDQTISGITPVYSVFPVTKKRVVVSFPGGRTEAFEPAFRALSPISEEHPNFQKFAEMSQGTLVFRPLNGAQGTLEVDGDPSIIWSGTIPGRGTILDFTFASANPKRFRYTAGDGTVYVIDELQGLLSLEDPHGGILTVNRGGISYRDTGLLFTRNASGRITEVTDPAGAKVRYGYDAAGRLGTVTDRTGAVTTFHYEHTAFPHYLTGITDPRGVNALRTEFDADGRLVRQVDAAGHAVEFEHLLDDRREIIRDRLGNTTVHEYDDRGNVTRITDALGGVTVFTYDENDNELTVTSPLGHVIRRSYDSSNNLLSETEPGGQVTSFTYDAKRRPLTVADALGQTTDMSYDLSGNLTEFTDAAGTATAFTYSPGGHLASIIDAHGVATTYTYDSAGRQLSVGGTRREFYGYDVAGNRISARRPHDFEDRDLVTSWQYDAEGRVTRTTLPDGSTTQAVYNAIGKPAKTIDAAGRETLYQYDALGHEMKTTFPDGSFITAAHDIEGRPTARTDAAGVTTYTLYDALGRATATILPDATMPAAVLSEVADIAAAPELVDNPRRLTTYDADGRVTATTDEHGRVTTFEYDTGGRRGAVVDALGQRTSTAYDAAGRQTSVTDAKGNTTAFEYDAAGRLTRTIFPDGTFTASEYDALGRRILATDAAGNVTEYGYNDRGNLVYVIDAEGFYTEYEYDSEGRQTVQWDARSGLTEYRYDDLGRRVARILPGGEEEGFAYDSGGRLVGHTDFNGHLTRREYDPLNDRLLAVSADPAHTSLALAHAPARHEFGYDVLGRRIAAVVKSTSGTVLHQDAWSYDLRSRVAVQASTTGTLRYAWDDTGTLAGVKSDTPGGYDLSYDYDALNRLVTVHEGQQGVDPASQPITAYGYDANGNLAGTSYLNQVTHAYAYNSLNRLTGLAVDRQPTVGTGAPGGPVATPLHGYGYALNAAGHRTGISELGGRTIAHTFDRLYRLTGETIGGTSALPTGQILYSYDEVGNRTTRSASGPVSSFLPNQTHSFDQNDHLAHHTYDGNGNTTASNPRGPGGSPVSASDVYSFDNRLIRRTRGDGLVIDLLHNAGGDRVAKWTQQGGLSRGIHRYLVDHSTPTGYAQVVEEKDGTGELLGRYFYGHDLIAFDSWITPTQGVPVRTASPERRWYHYDGLGSVRGLSDDEGLLIEDYTYDAYGTLIAFRQLDPASGQLAAGNPNNLDQLTSNRFLFTGEHWDPDLGMYFLRARYLNPETGRFHSMDSYEGRNGEPLSLHKYAYCHANPVSNLDPSGHFSLGEVSIVQKGIATLQKLNFNYTSAVGAALFNSLTQARLIALGVPLVQELKALSESLRPLDQEASSKIALIAIDVEKVVSFPTVFFNFTFPAFLASLPGKIGKVGVGMAAGVLFSAYRLVALNLFFSDIVKRAAEGSSFRGSFGRSFYIHSDMHPRFNAFKTFFGLGGSGQTPASDVYFLRSGIDRLAAHDVFGAAQWLGAFFDEVKRYEIEASGEFGVWPLNYAFAIYGKRAHISPTNSVTPDLFK